MIRLLVNPSAGRGSGAACLEMLRPLAERAGTEVQVSTDAEDLIGKARRAADDGVERLLVAGGDGTVHQAVQGLAQSGCALGFVPLGSGNDLANALGIPADPEAAVDVALTREPRSIDLGRVTGAAGRRWFAIYCGVGFDSEVTRRANQVRVLRGRWIYPWAVVKTLFGFRPPTYHLQHDRGTFDEPGMFITVANGPTFGAGMRIAPDARLNDGHFDLVTVRKLPKWKLLQVFPKVYTGDHVGYPEVDIVRTARVHIGLDREMTLYGDGEALIPIGPDGVEVEMVSGALRVIPGNEVLERVD